MEALQKSAREALENHRAEVIIGFCEGSGGRMRPIFVQNPAEAEKLTWNDRCTQNLAVYLAKPEVKKLGRLALVAPLPVLRAVLQLASENQIKEGDLLVLALSAGQVTELSQFSEMEEFVAKAPLDPARKDQEAIERLEKMTPQERWQYWQSELTRCFKCYACRAACPMCYCSRCTVECNQPQWIPVPAHPLGNWEWHLMRAMHLAGRCVSCGACGDACPLDIPIHLLTMKVEADIHREFGLQAGMKVQTEHALSSFNVQDKENFII
ncbi:MAG: hypothetical protein BWY83_02851 [bacterium ADurb.Bin478]|nr:MAG: hypothetical protein BWY83_02851 [bacterium ADurb.Bin478]